MLKYKFKVSGNGLNQDELIWREKYISPDLSFISGVTSTDYHLERFNSLIVRNDYYGIQSGNRLDCETVTRQGYIVVKKKPYEIISGSVTTYKTGIFDSSGKEVHYGATDENGKKYQCVFINGKYYYKIKPNPTEGNPNPSECFMITDFLVDQVGKPIEKTIYPTEIKSDANVNKLLIDTIYWIENGQVNIDGDVYLFNPNEGSNGTLRYFENGAPLRLEKDPNTGEANEIVPEAEKIVLHPYDTKNYEEVCKFTITSKEYAECNFEDVSCGNYYYYVSFKDNYLKVRETDISDTEFVFEDWEASARPMFVCEIPKYIIEPFDRKENQLKPLLYPIRNYDSEKILTKEDAEKLNIFTIQDLHKISSYVIIEKAEKIVSHDIQNSNNGNLIIVYINNDDSGVHINDEVFFYDIYKTENEEVVYNLQDYDAESGDTDEFVLYNGKKCKVYENLCDRAVVPVSALTNEQEALPLEEKIKKGLANEFVIDYINGKVDGKDAIVEFYGENIPMRLKQDPDDPTKWQLRKYGRVAVDTCGNGEVRASDILYDINPHDGILVNGKPYKLVIKEDIISGDPIYTKVVSVGERKNISFNVNDRIGSSMLICEPIIPNNLTRSFSSYMSKLMVNDVVLNQATMSLMVKNKVFGDEEITEYSGWEYRYAYSTIEDSLMWFYTEKYNPKILVPSGHILIPLNLNVNYANNTIQDDIVNDQFYRVEKEKAINDIVDMEKDVYSPMYIFNSDEAIDEYFILNDLTDENKKEYKEKYIGSLTEFKPIYEINLNFHFRTRTLDNWKVNERYDSAESLSADTDNWFVTDFHPYKDMLEAESEDEEEMKKIIERKKQLMDSSDLMGLLNFTYDDVFYQKSKVAKSFVRLSLYDSIDPQTQSLLDTSSVFVDEHSLYKKLIDNSRKNVNAFGLVKAPEMEYTANTQGQISSADTSKPDVVYKISLMTEFLGENKNENYTKINHYKGSWRGASAVTFDESHRISSRLTIKNKYQTDTSSEGFYHYIFREYSEDLHPKPIYMKIEYNHAGIGKIIPMLVPMKWASGKTSTDLNDYKNLKINPISALTLSDSNDIKDLKKGIPLSCLYSQLYIPFYAVYDFINKQYVYVIDERYLTENNKDILHKKGILNIDLFEMKIMDEVEENPSAPPTDPRKQKVGRININEDMFSINYFNK